MKQTIKHGIIAGIVFGIIDVVPMFFMDIPDINIAVIAAFINRFAIGLLIFTSDFSLKPWLKGIIIGLLLSLPDALITNVYGPIIGMGVLGGLIIGIVEQRLKKQKS